jgi:hypothetical protein
MLSSEAYRTTSKAPFTIFPTQSHPGSNLASLMHTTNWATIIISTMHPPSTLGLHVYEVSLKPFTFWLTTISAWSMHLTKAWSWITVTIQLFLIISKIQRQIYSSTLMKIMPHIAQCRQHSLPHPFKHCLWMAHLRSHSRLSIAEKKSTLPMNWKSISNYLQKISNLATQFSGGSADEVNFCTSSSWRMTFYVFLVSILLFLIHVTQIWIGLSQVLLLLLKGFSQVGGTPSLSDMLDSKPTQFICSCLLRSTSILSEPKLPTFISNLGDAPTLT